MQDLKAKLEKLRTEAEDCELIGRLATDIQKRGLFLRLAVDLRSMARDIEAMIATRPPITTHRPFKPAAETPLTHPVTPRIGRCHAS